MASQPEDHKNKVNFTCVSTCSYTCPMLVLMWLDADPLSPVTRPVQKSEMYVSEPNLPPPPVGCSG